MTNSNKEPEEGQDIRWYVRRLEGIIPKGESGKKDATYVGYVDEIYKLLDKTEKEDLLSYNDSLLVEHGVIIEPEEEMWLTLCHSIKQSGRKKEPEIIVILPPGTNNIDIDKALKVVVHKKQQSVLAKTKGGKIDDHDGTS